MSYSELSTSNPHFYPQGHDVPGNEIHTPEYSFNLINNIKVNNELDNVFLQESPYKYPQLIMSEDPFQLKTDQFYLDNDNSDNINFTESNCMVEQQKLGERRGYPPLNVNKENFGNTGYQKLGDDFRDVTFNYEPFNTRSFNSPKLQEGYSRNIDLDSELKRINHVGDNCFYDNYKLHPDEAAKCSGLYHHRLRLVNDYKPVNPDPCVSYAETPYKSVITPPNMQKQMPILHKESTNDVMYGDIKFKESYLSKENLTNCRLSKLNEKKCINNFTPFQKCEDLLNDPKLPASAKSLLNHQKNLSGKVPQHYNFNHSNYTENYPCQRLFNNFTKRSTLPNMHNTYDINPNLISS